MTNSGNNSGEAAHRSDQRTSAMFEYSRDAIALADAAGAIEQISPAVDAVLGCSATEFLGGDWTRHFNPDHTRSIRDSFQRALAAPGQSVTLQAQLDPARHSRRWVEIRFTNLIDSPPISAMVANFRDITDRKQIEQELCQRQDYWRVALTSIGDGVIVADAQGRVTFLNPVAADLCGWTPAEAAGQPLRVIFNIVSERTRLPVENPVEKVIAHGKIVGLANHTVLVCRDGRETAIDDSAAPIFTEDGAIAGVVLVFRDVQQKRDAEELQQRLAAIVESTDDIVISKTLDGIITSWNKGAQRILGYAAEEMIGQHVSKIMPPDHPEDFEKILSQVRLGKRVDHYETKRRRKDGTLVDVSLSVSPLVNEYGEIIGAAKVGRDITDQRRAFELQERLAAIVESSDDIIISKSLDGVIASWNSGAQRVLGYAAEEMIGQHVSKLMPPDHLEDTEKILSKVRAGERVEHYETRRRRKDGTIIDVSLTVSPIRDKSGKIIGVSKIGRDITAQKAMEREREESNRRKDEFLAMLAHELRNPIAAINGAAQLFGRIESEEDLEWAKDVIDRQIKHLSRLIDDLLDVSRITRGKINIHMQPLDLAPIVANAIEHVRTQIEERKHEINVSLASGELRLNADPLRLEQILVNLLANAVKYTNAGGKIWLTAAHEFDDIVIKVRDTGVGMPAELIPHIFDIFSQGDRTIARSEGGLGIGLTIVKRLVELHRGTVIAASDGPDQGSEFTLRFPALTAKSESRSGIQDKLPHVVRSASRVLVVDDNHDTARGLAKLFKLLGHDVQTAFDGQSAVDVALEFRPEVILLDIGLPGMSGYEVARRLRAEASCRNSLFIAVSGYGKAEDVKKSKEAGFDHHLVKPVDYQSLLTVMAGSEA